MESRKSVARRMCAERAVAGRDQPPRQSRAWSFQRQRVILRTATTGTAAPAASARSRLRQEGCSRR